VNWGLKKIVKDESEDLVDVLSPDNEWVDSKNLDVNNFSALWKWVDTEFIINESNIHQSENGYLYIVVDGIKYFNKWDYQHRYMKIFDEYWMPYFYIWEVRPGELIDECKGYVILSSERDMYTDEYEIEHRAYIKCGKNYTTVNYFEE
jgi:hypothetical protein